MKKLLIAGILGLGLVLSGCSNIEKETEERVRNSLKDPQSAQFQNVKGYCGEVNAKNSYGGYTGFKQFYVSNGVPVFFDEDADNPLSFTLGWKGYCEIESKLSDENIAACVSFANFGRAVVGSKLAGVPISKSKGSIKASTKEDQAIYFKVIDNGYEVNNEASFATSILQDCLSGEIKVPNQ